MLALLVTVMLLFRSGIMIGASMTDTSIIICLIIVIAILFFVISFYFVSEVIVKRKRKVRLIPTNCKKPKKNRVQSNVDIVNCQ